MYNPSIGIAHLGTETEQFERNWVCRDTFRDCDKALCCDLEVT